MAIKELSIQSIQVGGGGVVAEIGVKTEAGQMGMRLALKMANEPGISEAVTKLENEIEAAFVKNLAVATTEAANLS